MRIKMQKSKKESEEYSVEKDPIFSMTEQQLDVYIDHLTTIEELKEVLKKIAKLARYKK
jgi:hypothetical protein